MPRKKALPNKPTPRPAWAVYLRVSDDEAQNPDASKARQRLLIQEAVLARSEMPMMGEYADLLSGRTSRRKGYQRMLQDARAGQFSHVVVERPDRFGPNDTEALQAIDELDALGVAVRFASSPDLDPMHHDDRVMVVISFTLARRESMMTSIRVKDAIKSKRHDGGFIGRAPDGYISVEDDQPHRKNYARRTHHIEPDPNRQHIWREAWELLLTDQYTLAQICQKLHDRGYTYHGGRRFIEMLANGRSKANASTLSRIFHNPTNAGWVVSESAEIAPFQLRGNWQALISDEEYLRGVDILTRRTKVRAPKHKHFYLLKSLLHLEHEGRLIRMTGTKPNTGRDTGGNAYYLAERAKVHLPCVQIEGQMPSLLRQLAIDSEHQPLVRQICLAQVKHLAEEPTNTRAGLESDLEKINREEQRSIPIYAQGELSTEIWSLNAKLKPEERRNLLKTVTEKIVVDAHGEILGVKLHSPFNLLHPLNEAVKKSRPSMKEASDPLRVTGLWKSISKAVTRSSYVPLCCLRGRL